MYFRDRLTAYSERCTPAPHEDTCWYLGTLLERFCRSEAVFSYYDGRRGLRPLALLYGDALEAGTARERCLILQQLGDLSLFLGALFPGHFSRRGIQRDYVIGMGGSAYDYLADNARLNRHIFAELARMFTRMLDMVADACSREHELDAQEILGLYQRWLKNRDPVVAAQLSAVGIDLSGSSSLQ
tara:strand:+ start:5179 stop:5733 length:555 start_codon:yes stop_codon:yes gene_type:complete